MRIIDQSYEITRLNKEIDIEEICKAYCICYASSVPVTYTTQCDFIRKHRIHESPLEHSIMTVKFITNRGISHEIVRHRHCAYSQQSSRYCNYSNKRFGNEVTFIRDSHAIEQGLNDIWVDGLKRSEQEYLDRIKKGQKAEEARGCLPHDLATILIVSTNFREWRNIFKLRCDSHAHYQMRELMNPLLEEMRKELPCVFDDIYPHY